MRVRVRELRFHCCAYLFLDGVNVSVRLGEDLKVCLLVVIGVREDGEKDLPAVEDGYRERGLVGAGCSAICAIAD
jgi:transposase-like protein